MDPKMIAMLPMMYFSRKIDFTKPEIVQMSQTALIGVAVLVLTIHYFVYSKVSNQKKPDNIWVPPKPKPALPFGMGPPEEPLKLEDFEKTTYPEYETKLVKESAQQVLMSMGIALFMSFQFKVHMPLVMQAVMMPLTAMESVVLKKYLLGTKTNKEGGENLYHELLKEPDAKELATINAARAAAAAAASGSAAPEPVAETPKVEAAAKEAPAKESAKTDDKKKSTPAADLD